MRSRCHARKSHCSSSEKDSSLPILDSSRILARAALREAAK